MRGQHRTAGPAQCALRESERLLEAGGGEEESRHGINK